MLENKVYVMDIGSSEEVKCSLKNETNIIKWYDGKGRELNASSRGRLEASGGRLSIRNVQLSDGGTYECRGLTYNRFYTIYVNGRLHFVNNSKF